MSPTNQLPYSTPLGLRWTRSLVRVAWLLVVLISFGELTARLVAPVHETRQLSSSGSLYQRHDRVGYRLYPNIESKVQLLEGSRSVFTVTYRTDEFGRRRHVPVSSSVIARPRFLAIFGASTAFGMGLDDEETLAYFLHTQASRYEVFNYAADGYGPQSAFALVDSNVLQDEVIQDRGIAIYVLQLLPGVGGHAQTMSASFELTMARWGESLTFYDLDSSGRPLLRGTLRDVSPLKFYAFRFLQNFQLLNLIWPYVKAKAPNLDRDVTLMLRAWGEGVRRSKPMSRAIVVIHPFSDPSLSAQFVQVWHSIQKDRIGLYDYSGRLSDQQKQEYVAFNKFIAHPNAELNEVLSKWLVQDLNLSGEIP